MDDAAVIAEKDLEALREASLDEAGSPSSCSSSPTNRGQPEFPR